MNSTPDLVVARGLGRRYGDFHAVRGLDLDVAAGSIVALIGPSGGGKTTTLRLLSGLEAPTDGTVRVFGRSPRNLRRRDRRRLALLAQQPALVPELTLAEQVRFAADTRGVDRAGIMPALARVGLDGHADTRLADASGGMRRRTGLAATLIAEPELVFCDEPTAGLDPVVREDVWAWFRERRARGRAMVVTTQHIDEAARCDRVIVLREGEIAVDSGPDDLLTHAGLREQVVVVVEPADVDPAFRIIARTVGATPTIDGRGITVEADHAASVAAAIAGQLADRDVQPISIDTVVPDLDSAFIRIVDDASAAAEDES